MSEETSISSTSLHSEIAGILRKDFAAYVAGVLLGLPAWGILAPQIFSVLSTVSSFDLSSLFKLFSICYFTIPFFVIFLLVIFQIHSDLFIKLRRLMLYFVLLICAGMGFLLWVHSSKLFLNFLWILLILGLVLVVASPILLFRHIYNRYQDYLVRYHSSTDPDSVQKGEAILSSINFSILFLFIPIQWVIVFLLTANHQLYNSWGFLGTCLPFYLIPYLVYNYRWKPLFQKNPEVSSSRLTSNKFMPTALLSFGIGLWVTVVIAGGFRSPGALRIKQREIDYYQQFEVAKKLTDSTITELEYINKYFTYDSLRNAVERFKKENKEDTSAFQQQWLGRIDPKPLEAYLFKDLKNARFFKEIDTISTPGWDKRRIPVLLRYKSGLEMVARFQLLESTDQLLVVSRNVQKTGILALVSTLLILLFLLFMLYFKDDKYNFSTNTDINHTRRILGFVAIMIIILLVPLTKSITKERIKPYDPSNLFKLSNWNIFWDKNGTANGVAIDSLINRPSGDCGCCPTNIQQIFLDSAKLTIPVEIKLTGWDEFMGKLDEMTEALAKIKIGGGGNGGTGGSGADGNGGGTDLKEMLDYIKDISTTLKNRKPPYDVNVKNWPDGINLKKIEDQLNTLNQTITAFKNNTATKIQVEQHVQEIVRELKDLEIKLGQFNSKGSFINQKSVGLKKE